MTPTPSCPARAGGCLFTSDLPYYTPPGQHHGSGPSAYFVLVVATVLIVAAVGIFVLWPRHHR